MTNLSFPTTTMTQIQNELYRQEKVDFNYLQLVPFRNDISPSAPTILALTVETTGEATPIVGKSGETIKKVAFTATDRSINVLNMALSYDIDLPDILASQSSGNLDVLREKAAGMFEGFEAGTHRMLIEGNAKLGIQGLTNFDLDDAYESDSPATFEAMTGTAASQGVAATSKAENLVRVVTNAITACRTQTQGARNPNTIVLPLKAYDALVDTRFPNSANYTALDAILASSAVKLGGQALTIIPSPYLETDMLVYSFDERVAHYFQAMPLTILPNQPNGVGFTVPGFSRITPYMVRNPRAFHRVKGVAVKA